MKVINQITHLLDQTSNYFQNTPESILEFKPNPKKWSKKEILGHLVDSAINNLTRFIEVQFEKKPYPIRPYKQDEWVAANKYQHTETKTILNLFLILNQRIIQVISDYDKLQLQLPIKINESQEENLRFWINDYVQHMAHHVEQILEK